MAKIKGEVAFAANGADYVLLFSVNAICTLEERFDASVQAIVESLKDGARLSTIRTLFWAGLSDYHPMTELQAGELISQLPGGAVQAVALVGEAFDAAFGSPAKGAPARPPARRTKASTG